MGRLSRGLTLYQLNSKEKCKIGKFYVMYGLPQLKKKNKDRYLGPPRRVGKVAQRKQGAYA